MDERTLERLHAYHDGELGWWGRRRIESALEGSAELREELGFLRELRSAAVELDAAGALSGGTQTPDLWPDIRRGMDAPARGPAFVPEPTRPRWWIPAGAVATAAAAGLAGWMVFVGTPTEPVGVEATAVAAGTVRYLDTGGRGVVVTDREDVTIVWLIGKEEA